MLWKKIQKILSKPTLSMQYLAMEIHFSRYAFMQNLQTSRVTIYSLLTEQIKDFSTVAFVEEMNSFTSRRCTEMLHLACCKLVIFLDFALEASEVTLNTVLSSH